MAGNSRSFGAQVPEKGHLVRGSGGLQAEVQDLRSDADEGFTAMEAEVSGAAVAAAHIRLNVQATEGDTVVIGGDTYEFVDAFGAGVAGGIEVLITDAATQLLNIIAAINATQTAAQADGRGTEKLLASAYNTDFLRIENATRAGGTAVGGVGPATALTETLTGAGDWDHEELGRTGGSVSTKKTVHAITVDAFNLLNDFDVVVPGALLSSAVLYVTDAAGVPDTTGKAASIVLTDVPARDAVTVGLDDGGTDPIATDIVFLEITHR